ncbi:MAG: hypothetical protein ABJZ55_01165 [Fuerstiella sp.]
MSTESDACLTVAKGGVGESGASALLTHTVNGPASKIVVLRNIDTSLCPNTWALASLFVNGIPVASGNVSTKGSFIQAEVSSGGSVAAAVHAAPNFNKIVCARLGEASVTLEECDLVRTSKVGGHRGEIVPTPNIATPNIATRDWYAWNDQMPPKPDRFHVVGEVQVPNPGVDVLLSPRVPQGINPKILLLDLHLNQRPGIWPQIVVWKPVRYEKINVDYESVEIFYDGVSTIQIPVEIVQ